MYLVSSIITFFAGVSYTLRFSFIKDLKPFDISNPQTNFAYRAVSLPILLVILGFTHGTLIDFEPGFLLWFFISFGIVVFFNLYQVYIMQNYKFSLSQGLAFLDILFSTLFAFIILGETLSLKQLAGIGIIFFAFGLLYFFEKKHAGNMRAILAVVFFYILAGFVSVFSKKALEFSTPIVFTLWTTFGLITFNYILTLGNINFKAHKLKKVNVLFLLTGIFTAFSFLGTNYGFKYLPVGVVICILSSRVFLSLWLSDKKYKEKNLSSKVVASVIALAGYFLLFF